MSVVLIWTYATNVCRRQDRKEEDHSHVVVMEWLRRQRAVASKRTLHKYPPLEAMIHAMVDGIDPLAKESLFQAKLSL